MTIKEKFKNKKMNNKLNTNMDTCLIIICIIENKISEVATKS